MFKRFWWLIIILLFFTLCCASTKIQPSVPIATTGATIEIVTTKVEDVVEKTIWVYNIKGKQVAKIKPPYRMIYKNTGITINYFLSDGFPATLFLNEGYILPDTWANTFKDN